MPVGKMQITKNTLNKCQSLLEKTRSLQWELYNFKDTLKDLGLDEECDLIFSGGFEMDVTLRNAQEVKEMLLRKYKAEHMRPWAARRVPG
jgi:hypothetical protein